MTSRRRSTNGKDVCINCCPCCDSGLFFEIGGVVYLAVSFGRPWNGSMTSTITREVAEAMARAISADADDCQTLHLDGDALAIRDPGGEPDEHITPDLRGRYAFGDLGWVFCGDGGPADYQEVAR